MKTNIRDLIDFQKIDSLLEGFNKSTGFVTAILDLDGNVISKSGWRKMCTEFHRINPETSKRCTISDTVLANKMAQGEKYHFYQCLNGLVDVAVPIVIRGEHVANLFSGQFFFEAPNLPFFKKQANEFGFDEKPYLEALSKVPVISKDSVIVAMDFLLNMTQLISDQAFQRTEQEVLNKTLIEREERFQSTLSNMIEGCQIIGFDWRYLFINDAAEKHNRRPKEELLGNKYMEMWPGVENTEVFELIKDCKDNRIVHHFENEFTFPDGSSGWFDLSIQPVPEGVFILSIDITERKEAENIILRLNEELEEKIQQRTSQLEASNKELEAFSYSVSHDLRAPLRHINGYVDLLNERYKSELPEKAQHYLSTITNASKQMGVLIDDLLQFSRTGRKEVHKEKTDMNNLLNEVLESIKPDTINRNIHWNIQKLPQVDVDYPLMKQAWINLLDNAVKYTRNKPIAEISIGYNEEKEHYVFYIRDNGVGFNMKYAHKLFGVFQRLHSQSEFEGTGIGLANVQRIVHKHNGQIRAEAEPDKGATIFFSIPKKNKDKII
jgi:PAS domain S-box-containing protein